MILLEQSGIQKQNLPSNPRVCPNYDKICIQSNSQINNKSLDAFFDTRVSVLLKNKDIQG